MRRTFPGRSGVAAAVLLATGLAAVCPAVAKDVTVLIGQSNALSGPGAIYGLPEQRAVELAIKKINDAGGFKVGNDTARFKLVVYDDKANPTEATSAVRKLIDRDNVKFLVGFCCSAAASAVASFISNEDVLMLVSTAAERSITAQEHWNVFRTRSPADYTGPAAGAFIAAKGIKRLAVVGQLDAAIYRQYTDSLKEAYLARGGTIVAEETFASGARDMYAQLTRVKATDADGLFVPGYVEQAAFVYRQARELGIKLPIFGFTGGSEEQFLKVASAADMNGIFDLRPVELTVEALGPNAAAFVTEYKAMHGDEPTPNAPYAYDNVWALKAALEKAGTVSDVKAIAEALHALAPPAEAVLSYLLAEGRMFDTNGQAYTKNIALHWENGRWKYVTDLDSDPAAYSKKLRGTK